MGKATEKERKDLTAEDVSALLAERYKAPEYAYLPQVCTQTGSQGKATRYADALALSLWPSRGIALHGFEIKVSYQDWMSELGQPEKADAFVGYCDYWWIVATDRVVRQEELLPTKWGLIIAGDKGLTVKKPAPQLQPRPLDMAIICSMFRRVSEIQTPKAVMEAEYKRGLDEGRKEGKEQNRYEVERLLKMIGEFEKASGVKLAAHWSSENGRIGDAVRMVMTCAEGNVRHRIMSIRDEAHEIAKVADRALAGLPARERDEPKKRRKANAPRPCELCGKPLGECKCVEDALAQTQMNRSEGKE